MRSIIIYKSYTGYTEKYAFLLAETLKCQCINLKQSKGIDLKDYSTIIYGGSVRASKISGIKAILKKLSGLKDKNIVFFAVGANEKTNENTTLLCQKNLEENHIDYPLFYMQGGFDPDQLNIILKLILKKVAISTQKKADKDPGSLSAEDRDFLKFFQSKHNEVSQENMYELLVYINSKTM